MARGPIPKKDMLPALKALVGEYRPESEERGVVVYDAHASYKENSLGGRPRLRPSIHDAGMLELIASRIIEGHGVLSFMQDDAYQFPCRSEFYRELSMNPNSRFSTGIRLAREAAHYAINDYMRQLVDSIDPDNKDAIKAKLAWFQWHLGNLYPEIYGEKRQLNIHNDTPAPDMTPKEFEDIAFRVVEDV